ncbi:MAG: Mu transposase C-terminal domain-containing protein [Marinibacterium sp.]|nr:Mu transposase C-terminal domain-containing protein [Marinibacterium sp.]
MSEWRSANDWCSLQLRGLPHTRQGLEALSKRELWRLQGPEKARKRSGRGGGWEYHLSCLPDAAQADYARRMRAEIAETHVAERAKTETELVAATAGSLSARRRQMMEARAVVLRELERRTILTGKFGQAVAEFIADAKAGLLDDTLAKAAKVAVEKGRSDVPSRPTLYNWRKALREADGNPLALVPQKRPQETKQAMPDWMLPFLRHFARPSKPTIAQALDNFAKSPECIGAAPSYDQVRRALKALAGTSDYLLRHKGREGPLALKARAAYVSRSTEGLEPGTIYTADGKTFDAEVQHPRHGRPFRPEITCILDVATRKAVGWSVGLDENADGTASSLLHAAQTCGVSAILYADRGAGFLNLRISTSAHSLCARLGTTATHSLPYNSQARGVIERSHATIWNRLAKEYPSYMGKDMDRDAAKQVFKESRKALAIISGKRQVAGAAEQARAAATYARLIISWPQFLEDVARAIADYNDTPHSSLRIRDPETGRNRKASPNEIWAQFEENGFEPFHLQPGEADDLYRPYEKRRTTRGLIDLHTNSYFSLALEPFHGQHVFVGYDIHDPQHVWVRAIDQVDGADTPGALICVAEFAGNERRYIPVSAQRLAEEKRLKGRIRRIDAKREEAVEEARPQLEHQQVVQLDLPPERPPIRTAAPEAIDAEVLSFDPAPPPDRRNPYQDPDIDLAWNIVDAPVGTNIPIGHVRLMQSVLQNRAAVDMMKEVGLPLADLADRIAAAQEPLKSSSKG